jgi:DNA replication and repair protein RecF
VHIKSIKLQNFRNHKNTVAEFINGTNILVGANAQGKTNLLEAIYLSCVGRGWRAVRDIEMVGYATADGKSATPTDGISAPVGVDKPDPDITTTPTAVASISAENSVNAITPTPTHTATVYTTTVKKFGDITVAVKLGGGEKKAISINGIPISKVGELMGTNPCVFFSPDELRLIKDAPADRRRFLNIDISQIDKSYFYALIRYNKILSQRNAYLKSLPATGQNEDIMRGLSIWDEQLVSCGSILVQKRTQFVNNLTPHLISVHKNLTDNAENIKFSYVFCGFNDTEEVINNTDNIKEFFARQLWLAREKDLRLRTTTVGAHRDDIKIEINGKDIRVYGSQGQQRTAALSIKLAELQLFTDITNEKPILLLDDVFSELDSSRRRRLLTFIKNVQTVITTTEMPEIFEGDNVKVFQIKNGKIDKNYKN